MIPMESGSMGQFELFFYYTLCLLAAFAFVLAMQYYAIAQGAKHGAIRTN